MVMMVFDVLCVIRELLCGTKSVIDLHFKTSTHSEGVKTREKEEPGVKARQSQQLLTLIKPQSSSYARLVTKSWISAN